MTLATVEARTAAEVRKALVAEIREEQALIDRMDLAVAGGIVLRVVVAALNMAKDQPNVLEPDVNGVSRLELSVQREVSAVLMREFWPSVAQSYLNGKGREAKVRPVTGLNLQGLVSLYDSINARLSREAIQNDAWRIASRTVDVARRAVNA